MLHHQMLSLAIGSNFRILQFISLLATRASHFVHWPVKQLASSAVLWKNPIIQSNMHQVFTHMHSAVSIAPSFMWILIGILHAPHLWQCFPTFYHSTSSRCLPTYYSFIRTFKVIEEQIHNLPARETILKTLNCNLHGLTIRPPTLLLPC